MTATIWRPPQHVRALAIGIVRRGDDVLVGAVNDDFGATVGWRPPGGSIEFGERAAAALQREFMEELGLHIVAPKLLAVLENIYEHHGARGHDIAFVFATAFADGAGYAREGFHYMDGGVPNHARWVDAATFRTGRERLFPVGLIDHL